MARSRKKLGEILVGWGVITAEQAEKAATLARGSGKRLGDALVEAGFAKEDQVAKALAKQGTQEQNGEPAADRLPLVGEIMSRNVIAIDPNDSPRHAILLLLKHGIHSLPVVQDRLGVPA